GLSGLPLRGYHLVSEKVRRGDFVGRRFVVEVAEPHPHRRLDDVRGILTEGSLPARALERALAAFDRLAEAEAAVHGSAKGEVHFHEVGAVDSIVDIVGAALGLEHFGVDRLFCSRVRVGTGEVECAHGLIPVPAPGTTELLKGLPVLLAEGEGETTTPTGAAILAAWCEPITGGFAFRPERVGYGAGTREDTVLPNLLRITLGETGESDTADEVVSLAANLDDQSPETLAYAVDRLFEEGALDAWLTPILMKKGRPGHLLTCLAKAEDVARLETVLFRETTTFGVRRSPHARTTLARERTEVETPFGIVRVKVGTHLGATTTWSPEFEDCARLARERGVPVREVYEAAIRALPGRA
ncbi:MAG: nickel pincer cofactor biosynthesis protein LarC, partial [Planctomycetota bacterium]